MFRQAIRRSAALAGTSRVASVRSLKNYSTSSKTPQTPLEYIGIVCRHSIGLQEKDMRYFSGDLRSFRPAGLDE